MEKKVNNKEVKQIEKGPQTPVTIDGKTYIYEDLNPEQQRLLQHINILQKEIPEQERLLMELEKNKVALHAFIDKLRVSIKPLKTTDKTKV